MPSLALQCKTTIFIRQETKGSGMKIYIPVRLGRLPLVDKISTQVDKNLILKYLLITSLWQFSLAY